MICVRTACRVYANAIPTVQYVRVYARLDQRKYSSRRHREESRRAASTWVRAAPSTHAHAAQAARAQAASVCSSSASPFLLIAQAVSRPPCCANAVHPRSGACVSECVCVSCLCACVYVWGLCAEDSDLRLRYSRDRADEHESRCSPAAAFERDESACLKTCRCA